MTNIFSDNKKIKFERSVLNKLESFSETNNFLNKRLNKLKNKSKVTGNQYGTPVLAKNSPKKLLNLNDKL